MVEPCVWRQRQQELVCCPNRKPGEMELPWPKVQRRIAQLIQENRFYTQAEQGALDDIDPIAIRESLAERGIVDGQVVDAQKLDDDPFIQRVMADAEQLAAEEETPEPRFSVTITSDAFPTRRMPLPFGIKRFTTIMQAAMELCRHSQIKQPRRIISII